MAERQKLLNCIELKGDGEIFSSVSIIGTIWDENREYFEQKLKQCPHVSIGVARDETRRAGSKIRDRWGCLWIYPHAHLDGQVIEHPLDDWAKLRIIRYLTLKNILTGKQQRKTFRKQKRKEILLLAGLTTAFSSFLLLTCGDLKTQ